MSRAETRSTSDTVFEDLAGIETAAPLGPGRAACARTTPEHLLGIVETLKNERGFGHLELLTAEELRPAPSADASGSTGIGPEHEAVSGVELTYGFTRRADNVTVFVKLPLADGSLVAPSVWCFWPGAGPLEREVYDLFGVEFTGHPNLGRLVLRDDFVGHPLRKGFELGERGVPPEVAQAAALDHGDRLPDREVVGASPFAAVSQPGDPQLKSERLILNVGPQHPSTHGVLHVWLALDGEEVVSGQVTHGFLHRCIEKLCEQHSWKGCTPLLDRCDYVSGFHTELAYMLALEELMELETTPKADYIRTLMSELVRITSHHVWFGGAGMEVGAQTPFLYSFIDREAILAFFEEVTGARMMFNYFRPGGVKDDIPPESAERIRAFLKGFDRSIDVYDGLLRGNEIFRARTRGIAPLHPAYVVDYGVTGPVARASGVDIDLRRERPYAAYDRIGTNVVLGESGDTFDRFTVRMDEMRESARIALEALEGMPEGPCVSESAPKIVKPPKGAAYRAVESPRGELGVYVVSDGGAAPWRLKVRSPALSNLHVAPVMLQGARMGDVVPVLGSIDIVMGEVDR